MKNYRLNKNFLFQTVLVVLFILPYSHAQDIRWMRIGELQSPFNEIGAEFETEFNFPGGNSDYFSWPAQYGINQTVTREKLLWIGSTNFQDPADNVLRSVKIVGSGPGPLMPDQIFPVEIKLVGRFPHPQVFVDDAAATILDDYDVLDEEDPNLPCDRMIVIEYNTSMGISVTKKVMAFSQSDQSNYFIYDYVFKNTGIINSSGTLNPQDLEDVWFYFNNRYAFGGESVTGGSTSTWGSFNSTWGESTINHSIGADPSAPEFNDPNNPLYQMRGYYSWYGPLNGDPRPSYDEDWGCPKLDEPGGGTLASAKYAGCITLYADTSPQNQLDDINQPRTTWFISPDINIFTNSAPSQYDVSFMSDRWTAITEGHPDVQHDELVGDNYPSNYKDPRRNSGGGVAMGQGFGPYQLSVGDSIHIVFAEGVSGISWEKAREVGSNWLLHRNGTGSPALILPNGTTTTDYNEYKRAWVVDAGRDSIIKTFRNAINNYGSNFTLPRPPSPPSEFNVIAGGDRIKLTWADNASSDPHFNGYVIYRSRGTVLTWNTVYEKIYECDRNNFVHEFDDVTANRGFDYYYYIQSKDDGTQVPGKVLYSSLYWTVTNTPANLQRPAITGPPVPPANDSTNWKFMAPRGDWSYETYYNLYDAVSFNGLTYVCTLPDDSTGEPVFDSDHWRMPTSKGEWVSGSAYNSFDAVTYNSSDFVTPFSISGGSFLELVRVVPNPYDIRGRFLQFGDQSQYDRIAFYGLPPVCKLKIFTERGDLIYEKDHTRGTGDELWDSKTTYGQIVASGVYILYVETPDGRSVIRKFVIIR